MFARITMWILVAVFGIITVVFLSGHGTSLIAGYNTATEKERETVDEKKLCRVLGVCMLVCTIVSLVLALLLLEGDVPTPIAYVAIAVIVVDCIVTVYLANTKCKK